MKIVTAAEMREIDRATSEKYGVPSLTLMENAGTAVSDFALSRYPQATRISVICGKGNNGGDGFVSARKLHEAGKQVRLLLLAEPGELRGDAREMYARLPMKAMIGRNPQELASAHASFEADLLIDAILGTGFRPPVSSLYAQAIENLNQSKTPVIAVDIPSGADADSMGVQTATVARADAIVTFTAPRPAHVFSGLTPGPTVIARIGSPAVAIQSSLNLNLISPADLAPLIAPRPRASNKGSFGHALVVGGSLGKSGAAAMAGMSVLRVGAGLSTIATPKSVLATVAGFHPEIMTEPLAETSKGSIAAAALRQVVSLAEGKTVVAIGPGISRVPQTSQFVRNLLKKITAPVVLDADGLNAFEGRARELSGKNRPLVLTPHPGEMARLIGSTVASVQRDRINTARKFSREHNLTLVLKGHRTLVSSGDGEIWVNSTGNPGMSTGGTGDILTGMVAGLIAQNPKAVFSAVLAAVYLHGLAGDVACETQGEQSLVATDLIRALPEAFRRLRVASTQSTAEIHV